MRGDLVGADRADGLPDGLVFFGQAIEVEVRTHE
jgi:hypothetical protein